MTTNRRREQHMIPTLAAPVWVVVLFMVLVLALSLLRLLPRAIDLPAFLADGVLLFSASFGPSSSRSCCWATPAPGMAAGAGCASGSRGEPARAGTAWL
jgi:hypothetical protein